MARPVSKISPLGAALFELMDDGRWHDLEAVLVALGKRIPPGEAYRATESRRGTAAPRRVPRSEEFLIASGRRAMAQEVLIRQRRLERRLVDGVKQVRLTPARAEGGARRPGEKVSHDRP